MSDEPNKTEATILEQMRQGIGLARAGDRAGATALFDSVLGKRPNHEEALVWKAAVVDDPAEAVRCLEQALRLNPANGRARAGLEWANRRQHEATVEPALKTTPAPAPVKSRPPVGPPPAARFNATFQPGVETASGRPAPKSDPRSKAGSAPYKKHRLPAQEDMPSVELPPEALRWTKSKEPTAPARAPRPADSVVFREARQPSFVFSVAPKVARANNGTQQRVRTPVPLRWPLGLFGLALGLVLLAFPLSGLAVGLGGLALIAALMGVVLFNRVQF